MLLLFLVTVSVLILPVPLRLSDRIHFSYRIRNIRVVMRRTSAIIRVRTCGHLLGSISNSTGACLIIRRIVIITNTIIIGCPIRDMIIALP